MTAFVLQQLTDILVPLSKDGLRTEKAPQGRIIRGLSVVFLGCSLLAGCAGAGESVDNGVILVTDQAAYFDAVADAKPGDVITLANGNWEDFEIVFEGVGTADAPITLTAETKGQVILTGQSNLRLGGEHLHVTGLVFKDGFTPTKEVISYRIDKNRLANYSRVSEVVIDDYNQTERREVDIWVSLYGKNNRFDHNHLVGKRNTGVTLAVRMGEETSRENRHRIDHNYFGPRQILGSNGGETLRIGTSHYSLSNSFTTLENNYFDRADGELEIISSKSGGNIIRNNTFYQSRGTLTMRHGNNTTVEGNVFFGNDADHTGGIRVINAGQNVTGNYMEGLKGSRFGGALVVMNGVPNSPINRYHQVKDSNISQNSLINSDNIQLAAGSDFERSAVPIDSRFADNLIYHKDEIDVFTVYDDVSGIAFEGNILASQDVPDFSDGFERRTVTLERAANGLLYPADGSDVGAPRDLKVTTKADVGPDWYPKTEPIIAFGSGETHRVPAQDNALFKAVQKAAPGDTLILETGNHVVSKFIKLDKPLSFKGAGDVTVSFERTALFEILDGGSLQISDLTISGKDSPDSTGNSVIRTSPYAMLRNYRLDISNVTFDDIDVNRHFNIMLAAKGTFADYIRVENSRFKDVSGAIFRLDSEIDDYGIYNAEYLTILNSEFENVGGDIVDYYRGGTDESTFGPHLTIKDSTFKNIGKDKRNKSKSSLLIHGVQATHIANNVFEDSAPMVINHTVGEPKTRVTENTFINTPLPVNVEFNSGTPPTARILNNRVEGQ